MAKQPAKPTFEEALARLEAIVDQLDDGNLPLTKSLELFKEGTKLAAFCRDMLAQAELSVQQAHDGPRHAPSEASEDAEAAKPDENEDEDENENEEVP
jgi:exodeoxyribonuclease VII small subunit